MQDTYGPSTRELQCTFKSLKQITSCLNHNTHCGFNSENSTSSQTNSQSQQKESIFRLNATRDRRVPVSGWGLEGSSWEDAWSFYSVLWFPFLGLLRKNTCRIKAFVKLVRNCSVWVYVRVCVCMYVCMHACLYVHMCLSMHECVCLSVCVCVYEPD